MIARRASGSRSIWSIESPTRPNDRFGHVARLPLRVGRPKPAASDECEGQDDRDRGDQPEEEPVEDRWCGRGRLRLRQGTGVARSSYRMGGGGWARSACSSRNQKERRRARARESHQPGRRSRPAGSTRPPPWRSRGGRASASPCCVEACGSRSGPARCRDRRPEQRQAPDRRSPAGTSERRRSASQGEAALAIPTMAASRKPTTTTATTGGLPHSGRASPSITRSLRCSLIDDSRRYATEQRAAPAPPGQRSGNGLPASAGSTCAVTQTGVVP